MTHEEDQKAHAAACYQEAQQQLQAARLVSAKVKRHATSAALDLEQIKAAAAQIEAAPSADEKERLEGWIVGTVWGICTDADSAAQAAENAALCAQQVYENAQGCGEEDQAQYISALGWAESAQEISAAAAQAASRATSIYRQALAYRPTSAQGQTQEGSVTE